MSAMNHRVATPFGTRRRGEVRMLVASLGVPSKSAPHWTARACERSRRVFWNDRGSLRQAIGVARAQRKRVRIEAIREWCEREGRLDSFAEFERGLTAAPR